MTTDRLQEALAAMRNLPNPYQDFDVDTGDRRAILKPRGLTLTKHVALVDVLPPGLFTGKSVLDVGCATGYWSLHAALYGAKYVVAFDSDKARRMIGERITEELVHRGLIPDAVWWIYHSDKLDQAPHYGKFDVVLALSVAHHQWRQARKHDRVAEWYRSRMTEHGTLVLELPTDEDYVAKKIGFRHAPLLRAFEQEFGPPTMGPVQTISPTRLAWRFGL